MGFPISAESFSIPTSSCLLIEFMKFFSQPRLSRRDFLWRTGGGLGGIALAKMLSEQKALAGPQHFPAKAKYVIQLFMNGGVSQMDTFDYKPELEKRHGMKFDPGAHVEAP